VADRAVILEKGVIRFDGAMDVLMNDAGIRARYLAV
jgi:ABC-type branched-subunit amino acid transport system ATPase component